MTCIDWETTTSNNTNQYSPNNLIYSLVPIRSAWNPHSMSDHSPSSSYSLPPEQTFNGSLVLLIKQPKTTHHPEMVMDDVALPHKLIPPLLECLDQSMHRQRINKWSQFPIHSFSIHPLPMIPHSHMDPDEQLICQVGPTVPVPWLSLPVSLCLGGNS